MSDLKFLRNVVKIRHILAIFKHYENSGLLFIKNFVILSQV